MLKSGINMSKVRCLQIIAFEISRKFPEEVKYEKMLLWIRVNQGLSKEKAREYLNDVIESHSWHLDGEIIKASI